MQVGKERTTQAQVCLTMTIYTTVVVDEVAAGCVMATRGHECMSLTMINRLITYQSVHFLIRRQV